MGITFNFIFALIINNAGQLQSFQNISPEYMKKQTEPDLCWFVYRSPQMILLTKQIFMLQNQSAGHPASEPVSSFYTVFQLQFGQKALQKHSTETDKICAQVRVLTGIRNKTVHNLTS